MAIRRIPVEETFPWQRPVLSVLSTPPASPTKGDRHIVGDTATGAWEGHETDITWYDGAAWQFDTPAESWLLHDLNTGKALKFINSDWEVQPTATEVDALSDTMETLIVGVNTHKLTVSATEPLNPEVGDLWVDTSS